MTGLASPGSTLWLLRHDLRLAARDFRAAGPGRSGTVAGVLGTVIVVLHIGGFLGAPGLARLHDSATADLLLTGSVAIGGAFCLFLSKAISEATEALHQRGDLDLLLSSPLPMRRVLVTRLLAIAVIAGFLPLLMVVPVLDGMVLRGRFAWIGAYPVLAALALTASAAGAAMTFGLLAAAGPRTTRLAARALATLFGATAFLATQAGTLMPHAVRAAWWQSAHTDAGDPPGLIWWPARAIMGEKLPMLALAVLGAGAVLIVGAALGQAYGSGVMSTLAVPGGARAGGVEGRFRSGPFRAALLKEWRLLRRHPGLSAQLFYQFIFLVPGAIALMRVGASAGQSAMGVVFLTALMTGRITKVLTAGPYDADHQAALAETSPMESGMLARAKLLVLAASLLVVGGLPVVAIAVAMPHALPAAALSCAGAAGTRVRLALRAGKVLRKPGMKGRLSFSGDGLLGAMIDFGWGIGGAVLSLFI